jgi:hypothetical protein
MFPAPRTSEICDESAGGISTVDLNLSAAVVLAKKNYQASFVVT